MKYSIDTLPRRPIALLALLALVCTALLPVAPVAQAAPPVPVTYDSFENVIYVGDDYDPSDPAQAPFAGYPSHPNAPKTAITLPQVAEALNNPALLQHQGGGAWLLKVDMIVRQRARLELTSPSIAWLRLDSTPGSRFPALTRLVARGGHLLIRDVKITSWAGSAVDTNYYDGRSYLLAELGARMDIIRSEVSYLGWSAGEPSGLAWRKRGTQSDARTGATGSILESNIHDNYFGQYSYEAYGLVARYNQFHHNVVYGFDPHDYSTGFEVSYNKVYSNGKHGIIFSRGCTLNTIHHNEVYDNAEHGIMLDRGSNVNQISDNLVYDNRDGVAIFQSEKNLIQRNVLRGNERGVRINATFDSGDEFDGLATENVVVDNTIEENSQYGIYLYERADKNTIENNVIASNAQSGVYIKTGGNLIRRNVIRANGDGITIVGGEPLTPGGLPPSYDPGHKNVIQGNIVEDNDSIGLQLKGGVDTLIGLKASDPDPADANTIRTNGTHGVSFDATSTKNVVRGNTIHVNMLDGVLIKGVGSIKNRVTANSITANGRNGVNVDDGASDGMPPPSISTTDPNATTIEGTAEPNATVEVYRDPNGQGNVYKGATTAGNDGRWSFTLPAGDNPREGAITALAIDQYGNTSVFGGNRSGGVGAVYEIGAGRNGELTVYISGPGASVTLPDIQRALQVISPTTTLLQNQGSGVWQANASLFINRGVTLTLAAPTVTWLKLRSQATDIQLAGAGDAAAYNYRSFVTLRTYSGVIRIDGARVTSWDAQANTYDTDVSNGRSYILAKYAARLDITNATLSYLGSGDGESYGVSWRDINDSEAPDALQTRVTGQVINSTFSYNYYGVYTFQAANMLFRGNRFHHNIGYGFDPHDFSHHFIVEDNEAYANGNHGFIISRGCNNFIFRRNRSYDNRYSFDSQDRLAHGFMIDPGSPTSRYPQAPSHSNLLEENQAWGNDGYGLRIVGSISNTVRANVFTGNLQGITIEQGSGGNTISGNTITRSGLYGIYLIGGSDRNTISGNTITRSGKHGIYVKTGGNQITLNTAAENGTLVEGVPVGSGIAFLRESDLAAAAEDLRLPGERFSLASADPDLLGAPALASEVAGNQVTNNTVTRNADEGIEIKHAYNSRLESNLVESNGSNGIYLASGASGNLLRRNTARGNLGYGVKANGADVFANTWTENLVYNNGAGGIVNTSGANDGLRPPILTLEGRIVTGTAAPGTVVEIFSDTGRQGLFFEGRTTARSDGTFRFTAVRPWRAPNINATARDAEGNTSGFTYNVGQFVGANQVYLPLVRR